MIKNVVFDFGQVLVHFQPAYMVGKYVTDEADAKLLEEVLFDRLYWDKLDAGTITDEEVLSAVKMRIPNRLWRVAEQIYVNWIYNIPEMEGMEELILRIKNGYGKRVLLLSNISKFFAEHADEVPILRLIEERVFSAVCGKVKPDCKIFEHLCFTYGLNPEETIFIDDSPKNILGAEGYGICGYLFDGNVEKLSAWLEDTLGGEL